MVKIFLILGLIIPTFTVGWFIGEYFGISGIVYSVLFGGIYGSFYTWIFMDMIQKAF